MHDGEGAMVLRQLESERQRTGPVTCVDMKTKCLTQNMTVNVYMYIVSHFTLK